MYIAFIMKPMGDIDWVRTFPTEAEADAFGEENTRYGELDPELDAPNHWEEYDPPVVILFEAENSDALKNGKYQRPVAVYQRGEKWVCTR
jgi:hypothetical protein